MQSVHRSTGSITRRRFVAVGSISLAGLAGSLLAACSSPPPAAAPTAPPIVVTTVVEKAVTQIVEKQVQVTQIVEKQVIVTATPAPVTKPALQATTLSFWGPPIGKGVLPKVQELMNQPQIKIDVFPVVDYEKLKVAFAAASGPDLFRMNVPSGKFWMAKGVMMSLEPWRKQYTSFGQDLKGFVPLTINSYTFRGELMGVPISMETSLGYYNADWFAKAGLTTPDKLPSWDWNSQLEMALKLSSGAGNDRVYGMSVNWHSQTGSAEFIYGAGAKIISDDGLTATCGSKEMIEAFNWMVDLIAKHKVTPELDQWQATAGLNSFSGEWNWKTNYINTGDWGWWILRDQQLPDKKFTLGFIEPPKHPTTGLKGAQGHTLCVAIYSKTHFPEEAATAVRTFSTKDVQSLIPPEVRPARIDAQDAYFTGPGAEQIRPIVIATDMYAQPYPSSALDESSVNTFWNYAKKIFAQQVPVADGLKQAEKDMNAAIQAAAAGH